MRTLADIPDFSCGNRDLEHAYHLALGGMTINTRWIQTGLLKKPSPCLMAGMEYDSPWTRDAAINVYFAGALLDPEVARNTLLCVLEEQDGQAVIGGQYWDRIIWALGAERLWEMTRDDDFLHLACGAIRRTADICLKEEFDPEDGLFRGPAVYGDGVSAYPLRYRNPSRASGISRWALEHPHERFPVGAGIPMKALSTNCMYEHAFRVLARMLEASGEDGSSWIRRADTLKAAINRSFWNPKTGLYDYLAGECDAQEGMGQAFAILFDIADQEQARSVTERIHITEQGIPCVWPSFSPYDQMGYGRHSGTVWPHIQGFWALAALKAGRKDLFEKELFALTHNAVRDAQFAEIYHPDDGRIYGGIQDGPEGYHEWHSCTWQTWSASAYLAMIFYGVCGLDRNGKVILPEGSDHAELTGLQAE